VAEAPSPAPTPDPQHLQRLAETEAILTGSASIRSKNSNASKRHSMVSSTSPAMPVRTNSTEHIYLQPENYTPYPIRRRSHLTPGVATRVGEVSKGTRSSKVLQKPNPKARRQSAAAPETNQSFFRKVERSKTLPSEEEIQSYYYDQSKPSESPLESLERLAPLQKPRFRESSTEMQRMSTPTDLRHIGSFELGSLRIMNGAATPSAANTPKARKGPAADSEIDSMSPRTTAMTPIGKTRKQSKKHGNTYDVKQTRQLEIKIEPSEPSIEPPSRSASTATKQSSYSDKQAISRAPSQRLDTGPQVPGGADDLAEFYRLDIDFLPNPFSTDIPIPSSPKLEATSKHMAEQDELFEDDIMSPVKSKSPGLEHPSHLSETVRGQKDELYLPTIEPMSQRRHAQPSNVPTPARLGTLAVTDSGYSSYASLGSVKSSGSQSKLREASESPTQSGGPELALRTETDLSLIPSKPRLPKADFWKTQHAPSVKAGESQVEFASAQEETILPPPLRAAPYPPPKNRMPMPPIPAMVAPIDDSSETRAEAEFTKAARNSAAITPPKSPSLFQHRTTNNILQKSARRRPNSMTPHSCSSSDDSITPVKKKWQRNSTQLGSEVPITVQGMNEPESTKVPPVPKRLSLTFKERASRFSGLKQATSVSDNVEVMAEKPYPPPSTEEIQRSIRRRSSPVLIPNAGPVAVTPTAPMTTQPKQLSANFTRTKLTSLTKGDKEYQSRKEFERHITDASTVANSLGASPYDAGVSAMDPAQNRASNQYSAPAGNPSPGRPRRDRTGRIIGMDEESASNFARARRQVRAQKAERREILLSRAVQSRSLSQDGRAPAPVSNSNFANQLAIQSQRTAVSSASENVPSVPTLNVQDMKRQSPMKGKREKIGPPPSMMNGRNWKSGVLGFWSSAGGAGTDMDAQLDVPNRSAPMGPAGSVLMGEMPSLASIKKVGFSVAGPTANLPSMAPQWKGPTPKELAEMALAAKKEGRTSVDAQRRSMSANGAYDKKTGVVVNSRPSSVMSEREGGRRRGWSFRGRKEVEA
jgi:hypothetical protein